MNHQILPMIEFANHPLGGDGLGEVLNEALLDEPDLMEVVLQNPPFVANPELEEAYGPEAPVPGPEAPGEGPPAAQAPQQAAQQPQQQVAALPLAEVVVPVAAQLAIAANMRWGMIRSRMY